MTTPTIRELYENAFAYHQGNPGGRLETNSLHNLVALVRKLSFSPTVGIATHETHAEILLTESWREALASVGLAVYTDGRLVRLKFAPANALRALDTATREAIKNS